jgi:CO dehydrogenase/acetyl-CoA synthase gamma subunit (corrinoid Fe-S protein)
LNTADLYTDKISFQKYLNKNECIDCSSQSCDAFISSLKRGEMQLHQCSFIARNNAYAFEAVDKITKLWPEVPLLLHPRPAFAGLVELNQPDDRSLVLVSGNNEFTEQVLLTVLGTTVCPFYVLFVDTDGNTVDMAILYKTLTAERIRNTLKDTDMENKISHRELIIPGLAAEMQKDIAELTGWNVRVGPVCAAELPLFLSAIWIPPEE